VAAGQPENTDSPECQLLKLGTRKLLCNKKTKKDLNFIEL